MRWDCAEKGCFNVKCRPKIEEFADCFPGNIKMGDIDGAVEINAQLLWLEWKGRPGLLRTGQRIMYENVTRQEGHIVFVVEGDAETMRIQQFCYFWKGRQHPWILGNLDELKPLIKRWAIAAKRGMWRAS
jgi:hypothetical protein